MHLFTGKINSKIEGLHAYSEVIIKKFTLSNGISSFEKKLKVYL